MVEAFLAQWAYWADEAAPYRLETLAFALVGALLSSVLGYHYIREWVTDRGGPARERLLRGLCEHEFYRVVKQLLLATQPLVLLLWPDAHPVFRWAPINACLWLYIWSSWRTAQMERDIERKMGDVESVIRWKVGMPERRLRRRKAPKGPVDE